MHDIWNLLSTPLDQKERGVMKITTLLIFFLLCVSRLNIDVAAVMNTNCYISIAIDASS
jgi:hypothetical protein